MEVRWLEHVIDVGGGIGQSVRTLQYRAKEWIGTDQFWGDWEDVPTVGEND